MLELDNVNVRWRYNLIDVDIFQDQYIIFIIISYVRFILIN